MSDFTTLLPASVLCNMSGNLCGKRKNAALEDDTDGHVHDTSSPRKRRNVIRKQGVMETLSTGRSQQVVTEEDLYLEGTGYVRAILLPDCLTWHLAEADDDLIGNFCWGRRDTEKTLGQVPISEIYAAEMCEMSSLTPARCCGSFLSEPLPQMYRFAVHTFQRSQSKKCNWIPKVYTFWHETADICQAWVAHIQGLLDLDSHRPTSLLVLVNPYGGKGTGVQEWDAVAPMFERARVRTKVVLTERAGHAHDVMVNASEEDLRTLDGVVVVGGDGLFNEVLNGLLIKRHKGPAAPKPQFVSEMLAKTSGAEEKSGNNSTKGPKGFGPVGIAGMKIDPLGLYDVHSPLLKPHPAVDSSRSTGASTASSSSNSTPERPSKSNVQQEAVNTVLTDLTSGKEIELSELDSGDLLHAGTSPETGILKMDGERLVPVAIQTKSSDGAGPSSLTSVGQHNNLGMTNFKIRIGIIPSGSTDTVAISTTGSRDPVTATLHILLGDSMPLDVVRLTGWKKSHQSGDEPPTIRYAASFAGYGFYGDVMKESETTRWMGPARYDIAGVKVFLKHKKYMAEVSFLEMPTNVASAGNSTDSQRKVVCRSNCFVCSQGVDWNHLVSDGSDDDEAPREQPPKPKWRTIQDSFHSVGAAVMSCRNDKAPDGLVAHAHLSDGLLHLILIKSCSRPNYLRQLINLTRRGADPLDFDFVEHYKTPFFTFTSHGEESVWNVDGELFPAHQLSAQCFRGLVDVFARRPEY